MDVIAALIVLSIIGTVLCARFRAAVPALFFGVFAVILFVSTPIGSGLPELIGDSTTWIGQHGGDLAQR